MSNPVNDLNGTDDTSVALDRMARGRRTVSIVMVVAGLLFTAASLRLDRGDLAHPGPGLFPILVGGLAVVAGLLGLLELKRGQAGVGAENVSSGPKPWFFIAAMTLGVILLPAVGFLASAFVTATCVSWVAGQKTWWKAALIGVCIALIATIAFHKLGVYLPSTILDEWV